MSKSSSEDAAIGTVLVLGALAIPTLIAAAVVVDGYVLSVLWGWFVVPAFHIPALTIPYAIGVSMVAASLTNHRNGKEAEKEVSWWQPLLFLTLKPAFALGLGWIVKAFI
jgi:hypothetical protein